MASSQAPGSQQSPPSGRGNAQSPRLAWARSAAEGQHLPPSRLGSQPSLEPAGSSSSGSTGGHHRTHSWGTEPASTASAPGLNQQQAQQRGAPGANWPEFRGNLAAAAQGAFAVQGGAAGMPAGMPGGFPPASRWESQPPGQMRASFGAPGVPQLAAPPSSSSHPAQPSTMQGMTNNSITDGTSDEPEESEAAVRRAARALRLFFSGAQVRAIAAAPPSQYANIPIAGQDPSKPPSALAQSLRLALKLLSQESPQGSRFRARLLLALASPNEKEPALCGAGDPTKALSSSIEAQIFGMNGAPEEELAPFFALTSPVGSVRRQESGQSEVMSGVGDESILDQTASACASTMTVFNFEDNLSPGLAPSLGLGASVGLSSSVASGVTGVGGSSSSSCLAPTIGLGSSRTLGNAWASSPGDPSDPSMMSFDSAAVTNFPDAAQELDYDDLGGVYARPPGRLAGNVQAELDRRELDPDGAGLYNEFDDGRASEEDGGIASASARESEGEPAVSMRGSEASTQPPSDPAWDSLNPPTQSLGRQQSDPSGFAASARLVAKASGGPSSASSSTIRGGLQAFPSQPQTLSISRRGSLKSADVPGAPASPPRRARRVLPSWVDLKDQTSREPSAAADDGRAKSPPNLVGGRATNSPNRGHGVGAVVGPVAWSSVQCNHSVSPHRDGTHRESPAPGRRGSGTSRPRRVHGAGAQDERVQRSSVASNQHQPMDLLPLRLQNLSSPSRVMHASGSSGGGRKDTGEKSPRQSPRTRNGSPVFVRGQASPAVGSTGSPSLQPRDAGGARTPVPARPAGGSGSVVDRQGSTLRLRKDRDSCQRAIAAQFQRQGSKAETTASQQECDSTKPAHSPSPNRMRPSIDFYAVGKLIGKGAFGKVNVGVHKLTEELTAMKLCERRRIAEVAKKCLMQEVSILRRLNGHPNMIQLFEVIETSTHIVLVMEFAAGGDLLRYVRQRRRLGEDVAQDLFKQLADGIGHMHVQSVVHRDVKLENLLLDSFGCLKIADFGVAVVVKPPGKRLTEHCGTPSYIAPEILLEAGYEGQPVDVWSSGVVLYAMLCGRVPFKGENLTELKRCIVKGRFHFPSHLSEQSMALLKGMIVVDPRKRFVLRDVLVHPWLEGVANRAELLYGQLAPACPPEAGRPEGARSLAKDASTKELLARVVEFGFPQAFIEESLQEGKLNHATATFHLLAQQVTRKRASTMASAPAAAGVAAADDMPADDLN